MRRAQLVASIFLIRHTVIMSSSTASSVELPTRLERASGLSRTLVHGQARQVLRRRGAR